MDMVSGHYDPTWLKYKPRKLGRNPTEISAVKLFQKYTEHRLKERELSHSSKVRLTGKSRTIWALDPLVRSMLLERFDRVNPQPDDLVFPSPKGLPIDDHRFRSRAWKTVLESCQIEYRSPYNLRHSSLSHAGERPNADLTALAEQSGHSRRMLETRYLHSTRSEGCKGYRWRCLCDYAV